jgi:hypothetical protein
MCGSPSLPVRRRGVGHLNPQRPPLGVRLHRWRQFLTDCNQFLGAGAWAEHAVALGWTPSPCSVAAAVFHSRILAVPVYYGSSMAAGWSSFVATGPLLSWRRMGRRRIFDRRRPECSEFHAPLDGAGGHLKGSRP